MLKLEVSDWEFAELLRETLTNRCTNSYPDTYSVCTDGMIERRVDYISPKGRKLYKYVKEACQVCAGRGKILSESGKYLVEFMKEWSN